MIGPRRGGRIIQISSMGGQIAIPAHSAYHAAKWGLEGFPESVRGEVDCFGVHLTIVEPGGACTGFVSGLRYTQETARTVKPPSAGPGGSSKRPAPKT